jgi:hypothetical protein
MRNILTIVIGALLITACGEPRTMEERLDSAHVQFQKAKIRHSGNRSTHLPVVGKIKADAYKHCIAQRWYRYEDSYEFCAWHAEIGKWQYKG